MEIPFGSKLYTRRKPIQLCETSTGRRAFAFSFDGDEDSDDDAWYAASPMTSVTLEDERMLLSYASSALPNAQIYIYHKSGGQNYLERRVGETDGFGRRVECFLGLLDDRTLKTPEVYSASTLEYDLTGLSRAMRLFSSRSECVGDARAKRAARMDDSTTSSEASGNYLAFPHSNLPDSNADHEPVFYNSERIMDSPATMTPDPESPTTATPDPESPIPATPGAPVPSAAARDASAPRSEVHGGVGPGSAPAGPVVYNADVLGRLSTPSPHEASDKDSFHPVLSSSMIFGPCDHKDHGPASHRKNVPERIAGESRMSFIMESTAHVQGLWGFVGGCFAPHVAKIFNASPLSTLRDEKTLSLRRHASIPQSASALAAMPRSFLIPLFFMLSPFFMLVCSAMAVSFAAAVVLAGPLIVTILPCLAVHRFRRYLLSWFAS